MPDVYLEPGPCPACGVVVDRTHHAARGAWVTRESHVPGAPVHLCPGRAPPVAALDRLVAALAAERTATAETNAQLWATAEALEELIALRARRNGGPPAHPPPRPEPPPPPAEPPAEPPTGRDLGDVLRGGD